MMLLGEYCEACSPHAENLCLCGEPGVRGFWKKGPLRFCSLPSFSSCQSCRRKKARCSREQPCSQCVRFGTTCIYDDRKLKPGFRAGAMDSLSRRFETLENMFFGAGGLPNGAYESEANGGSNDIHGQKEAIKRSLLQMAAANEYEGVSPRPTKRQSIEVPGDEFQSRDGRMRAIYILYAIIAAGIRFVRDSRLADEENASVAERCRQRVVLHSMKSFSVEKLQALVIIAFDTVRPSSWSVVGSTTRTVEHLQLGVEEDDLYSKNQHGETLIRRITFLKPSACCQEAEERRRVFWTAFLMDRFCSVSTGWNISLTGVDVKRRLPCEGTLWQREEETRAPYFGIPDASSPITVDPTETDSIGGKPKLWLMRFKELDLRLVQWKLFLPSRWREVSTLNADGIMDSNLTLAHITHNTAIILLQAASDIATFSQQFLACSSMLTNPQFSFCLFYCAVSIHPALDTLIASLAEISVRWSGSRDGNGTGVERESLASVFTKRLVQARGSISSPTATLSARRGGNLDIRQTVYSESASETASAHTVQTQSIRAPSNNNAGPTPVHAHELGVGAARVDHDMLLNPPAAPLTVIGPQSNLQDYPSDPSLTFGFPPLPLSFQQSFEVFTLTNLISATPRTVI
ncbi:putative C6 transcription factor [Aspergillus undulatus]|uniref:putative C6 transcription factor n=1 Tax=Aspergillus undulatus TaxID=1810928 RepID=UPI003CCE5414